MKNRVTLKELSKLLNLSISTVSKSLNDSSEISLNTKKRVRDIAHLHNYIPNNTAKNLKNKQTNIVGVIVPSLQSTFFSAVLEGIEAKANEMNYKIFLYISNKSLKKEKECVKRFVESQVDGIIIFPSLETRESGDFEHLNELKNFELPLVIFDRDSHLLDCDRVCMENSFQSELAVQELHNAGCRKIAFVSDYSENCIQDNHINGYYLSVNKLKLPTLIIKNSTIPYQEIANMVKNRELDGIIACNQDSANNLMKHIRNTDSQIQDNIPIIAFSNGFVSKNFLPINSTLDQKANTQGQLAVKTLVDRITGILPAKKINYLIKRGYPMLNKTLQL